MTRTILIYGGLFLAVLSLVAIAGCAREPSGRFLTNAVIYSEAHRAPN